MIFDGKESIYPYKCDPANPDKKCQIKFNMNPNSAKYSTGQLSLISSDCKCSLSSQGGGFC